MFFAAFSGVVGVLSVVADPSNPQFLLAGASSLLAALIKAVLALFIRRGLVAALWIAAALFVLDIAFQVAQASVGLFFRLFLVVILIRQIRRERVEA